MCGIAGFLCRSSGAPSGAELIVRRMTDALVHRGPDGSGIWVDEAAGVALGHRRLAIIDLSPAGHQPMASAGGRWIVTYNGEVYNFRELRKELEAKGVRFRGHSDTEVIVEGFSAWGVQGTVRRLVGMFALAAWDREERTLYLVRDRIGVKPLYWADLRGTVVFGSELRALREHPLWLGEIDPDAVAAMLRYSYIPAPATVHRGVSKLPAAAIMALRPGREPEITRYWDLRQVAAEGIRDRDEDVSDAEATEAFENLLRDAVARRMVADVPVGAFLSGGVDSSTVVALMQASTDRKVRSFSIGFHEKGFNEAEHAKAVAAHLGTDHHELYVGAREVLDLVPEIPRWFDEPFADASQIPTYLVASMTRRHVTVALSGDGGDEMMAGYDRYAVVDRLWSRIAPLPLSLRGGVGRLLRAVPAGAWDAAGRLLPAHRRPGRLGDKVHKLGAILGLPAGDDLHHMLVSHWHGREALVPSARAPVELGLDAGLSADVPDFVERMQVHDALSYLPDDVMVKVDRASMAVSLEAREPLLDHRLIEFAWRLPRRMKIRDGRPKWLLRQVLYRHVPPALVDRPKMGFSVPVEEWLRGPLRDWAEELIAPSRLRAEGILEPDLVRRLWSEHQSRSFNRNAVLWNVLMFQAWKESWGERSA